MIHLITVLAEYVAFCALALPLFIVAKLIYNVYLHPLRRYPGPKSWAATRLMWAYSMQSGNLHHKLHKMHQKYGPVVRIAPDELSFIDSRAIDDIYGTHHGHNPFVKNRVWGKQPESKAPTSIVSWDEPTHLRNRRALMGAFTEHAVTEYAPILESLVGLMIEKFRERVDAADGKTTVNIVEWLNWLIFDISGALSFGESFDSVKNGKAHPWVDISCSFGKGIALVASVNFFSPLDKLLKLAIPASIIQKMQYHQDLAKNKVQQLLSTQQTKATSRGFVGSILQYNEDKGEVKIPDEEIQENMTILVFAGSETTSTAMASILTQLLRHPEALSKVVGEIRRAFDSEDDITVDSVKSLEYLTAVIKEGIRMGPPAAITPTRVAARDGGLICGNFVPGGTFVAVNQYPAFRSSLNFTQPDSFIPERFIATRPGDNLPVFEPFLVGRHKCIGQKLAWAEMRLTIARLLFVFDIKAQGNVEDFGKQKTFIFWEKHPLQIELRSRDR